MNVHPRGLAWDLWQQRRRKTWREIERVYGRGEGWGLGRRSEKGIKYVIEVGGELRFYSRTLEESDDITSCGSSTTKVRNGRRFIYSSIRY